MVIILVKAGDGPSPGGHTPEQEGEEHWSAKVGTKSMFPCFPATAFSSRKRAGNPQLAHKKGHVGKCGPCSSHWFVKLVQSGKSFYSLQCELLPEAPRPAGPLTCCPALESQMLRDTKGAQIPGTPGCALQTHRVMVAALLRPCSLLWEGGIPTELFQARWCTNNPCKVQSETSANALNTHRGADPLSNTLHWWLPGAASTKTAVMYPVKILSFNQWCVQCLLLGWVLACSEERNKD